MNKKLGYAYLFIAFGLFLILLYHLPAFHIDMFAPRDQTIIQPSDGNHLFWFVENVILAVLYLLSIVIFFLQWSHVILLIIGIIAALLFAGNKFLANEQTEEKTEEKAKRDTKTFIEGDRVYTLPVAGVDKHKMYGVVLASDYNTPKDKKRVQFDGIATPHQVEINYLHHAKSEE